MGRAGTRPDNSPAKLHRWAVSPYENVSGTRGVADDVVLASRLPTPSLWLHRILSQAIDFSWIGAGHRKNFAVSP
jgi:hypothetical protein